MILASKLIEELSDAISIHGDAPVTIELGGLGLGTRDVLASTRKYNSFIVGYIGRKLHFSLQPEEGCNLYTNKRAE